MTFGHVPEKVYSFVTRPGTERKAAEGVVVEADRELESVVGKMKNLWLKRQDATIKVGGNVTFCIAMTSRVSWTIFFAGTYV